MRSYTKAGLLYFLPALAILGVWYEILFVGNPPGITPSGTLRALLSDDFKGPWLRWFAVLPVLCLGLAGVYLSGVPKTRKWAIILAALGTCLAAAAWLTVQPSVSVLVTLPLVYGFLSLRSAPSEERHGT